MDVVLLSRLQFAFTIAFHYIFPPLTIGMGVVLVYGVLFLGELDRMLALLGIFGNDDRAPSPEQVDRHEAELKKHGKSHEFYRYDGAGHGIFYWHRPLYRPEQAMDGWDKVFAFLEKYTGK